MKLKLISLFVIVFASFILTFNAFAENCNNLNQNSDWNSGMTTISSLYKAEKYDQALDVAKSLYNICSVSPTLLYYMGNCIEKKGDKEHALIYYQKASENITQMAVEPGISRQIWYKRYELEHPERTEESVNALKLKADELERKNIELSTLNAMSTDSTRTYKALMWTGIGSAIGGVILASTGGALVGGLEKNTEIKNNKAQIKSSYLAGWTLLGTGIGLTILGSTLAGIAGYHYSKNQTDAVLSLQFSPNGASFEMTF